MPLPASGAISLSQIAAEFGGSTPHSMSEYYAAASGIPSSGAISFSQFHGKSALSPAMRMHEVNFSGTITAASTRTVNTRYNSSYPFPNIWNCYRTSTTSLTFTYSTSYSPTLQYLYNFDGIGGGLWANAGSSTYYTSGNSAATAQNMRNFFNTPHCYSMVFYANSLTSNDGDSWQTLFGGLNTNIMISLNSGKLYCRYRGVTSGTTGQSYKYCNMPTAISTGTWYHAVLCYYGTFSQGGTMVMELWINNVLKARTTWTQGGSGKFGDQMGNYSMYFGHYAFSGNPPGATSNHNNFAFNGGMGHMSYYPMCPASTNTTIGNTGGNAAVAALWADAVPIN